jgi:hypothetical protein
LVIPQHPTCKCSRKRLNIPKQNHIRPRNCCDVFARHLLEPMDYLQNGTNFFTIQIGPTPGPPPP